MANLTINQILIKRGNTQTISNYTGPHGELILNTDDNTVYVQDGVTQGGHLIGGNATTFATTLANLQTEVGNIAGITGNVAVLEAFFANANILSITSNVSGLQTAVAANASNISVLQTQVYGNANVATYLPTDPTVTGIQANIVAANTAIVTANTAVVSYVNAKIALLANAPAILDTLGQIATAIQTDEANIGTLLTNLTSTNANIAGANAAIVTANTAVVAYVNAQNSIINANVVAANAKIATLQSQVYSNVNASAYLLTYLPGYSGNLNAGNLTVSGNINYVGNVNTFSVQSGQFAGNAAGFGALYAGILSGYTFQPDTVIQASSNFNNYAQINHQNINGGSNASTDYVATADIGTASSGYIDMGINNSGFVNGSGNELNWPLDGYLYVNGTTPNNGNLLLATATAADVVISTNGAGLVNQQARFKNNVGLILYQTTPSTSTGTGALQVAGGAGIAGNVFAGNLLATGFFYANGTPFTSSNYGNTQVAAYLVANPPTGTYSNTNVAAYLTTQTFYSNSNVAAYLVANPQGSTYSNTNVTAYLSNSTASTGNVYAGNLVASGNVYGQNFFGNITTGANITASYFITTGTYGNISQVNTISANNYVYANGVSILTGIGATSTYGDSNVSALLSGNTVSNISLTSNASITGNLTVGTGQGGLLFRKLAGGTGAAIYNTNVTPSVLNYNMLTDGGSLTFNTASGGSIYTGINNSIITTVASTGLSVTGSISASANITATGNVISPNYLFANGVNILSTIAPSSTYSNANVVANLQNFVTNIVSSANITAGNVVATQYGNSIGVTATYSGNVSANYFVGNGAALTNLNYNSTGNIVGTSSNVNLVAGTYTWTFDTTGNLTIPTTGNIVYANGTVFTSGTGSGGTNYTNANVAAMLAANTSVFVGNTGNVATIYPIQSNITQVFIGGNTAVTSGNAAAPNSTFLMYNGYFAANGAIVARNTTTGIGYVVIDSTGIGFNGYTGAVTANTVPTFNQFLKMNGSIGAQFSGAVTSGGTVTGVGLTSTGGLTLNTSGTITTNQTSAAIFTTTATSIAIGSAATTVTIGSTASASNVFVGNAVGTQTGNLTLIATGAYNYVTGLTSSGGYANTTYTGIATTGGSGTGMIVTIVGATSGYLSSATVTNPGTGYKNGDTITIPASPGNGGSFVLQNYNSTKTGNGLANYLFGMDGNLYLPGNVSHATNTAIYGDFTNSTVNYRTIFRPLAANSNPGIYAAPTGTGTAASWQAANSSDLTNTSKILIATNGTTDVQLVSGINGSGTYLPLSFYTNGSNQMQLGTAGNLLMVTGGNIATTGNVIAGNVVATQYGNSIGTSATYTGNVTANYFVGNGAALTGVTASVAGNIYGTSSNVTIVAGTYSSTFSNIGAVTMPNVTVTGNLTIGNVTTTMATNGYNNWKANTYANVDNISASVFSNGVPAVSSITGTLNYFWSSVTNLTGGKFWGNTSTGGAVTTTPTVVGSVNGPLASSGDTVTVTFQDQDLKRIYTITYAQTVGSGNCAIVATRIL